MKKRNTTRLLIFLLVVAMGGAAAVLLIPIIQNYYYYTRMDAESLRLDSKDKDGSDNIGTMDVEDESNVYAKPEWKEEYVDNALTENSLSETGDYREQYQIALEWQRKAGVNVDQIQKNLLQVMEQATENNNGTCHALFKNHDESVVSLDVHVDSVRYAADEINLGVDVPEEERSELESRISFISESGFDVVELVVMDISIENVGEQSAKDLPLNSFEYALADDDGTVFTRIGCMWI